MVLWSKSYFLFFLYILWKSKLYSRKIFQIFMCPKMVWFWGTFIFIDETQSMQCFWPYTTFEKCFVRHICPNWKTKDSFFSFLLLLSFHFFAMKMCCVTWIGPISQVSSGELFTRTFLLTSSAGQRVYCKPIKEVMSMKRFPPVLRYAIFWFFNLRCFLFVSFPHY